MKKAVIIFGAGLLIIQLTSPAVKAAIASNGITISPAIIQLNVDQKQTATSFTAHLSNNTPNTVNVTLFTSDFTALNTSGGIDFLNNDSHNIHGLADSIFPDQRAFIVAPSATQAITVNLIHLDQLAPGGHYGALIYRVTNPSSTSK